MMGAAAMDATYNVLSLPSSFNKTLDTKAPTFIDLNDVFQLS